MLPPKHKETRLILAGDLITMTEQVSVCNNIITVSATKMCSRKQRFLSTEEITAKATDRTF